MRPHLARRLRPEPGSGKNIDLVYRLQGLDAMAEASRRQRLQQALNLASAVAGIAKEAAGQASAAAGM